MAPGGGAAPSPATWPSRRGSRRSAGARRVHPSDRVARRTVASWLGWGIRWGADRPWSPGARHRAGGGSCCRGSARQRCRFAAILAAAGQKTDEKEPARDRADAEHHPGQPDRANCRSCTRESSRSETIDPMSASIMSHCVSHGSPWCQGSRSRHRLGQRRPELDQFVECAEREAEADDHERKPAASRQRGAAE